jgi:hypothetical protein
MKYSAFRYGIAFTCALIIVLPLLTVHTTCASEPFELPKYDRLSAPVLIRFKAVPEFKTFKTTTFSGFENGNRIEMSQEMKGTYSILSEGSLFIITNTIDELTAGQIGQSSSYQTIGNGSDRPYMEIKLWVDERGRLSKYKLNKKSIILDTLSNSDEETLERYLDTFVKQLVSVYSRSAVKSGDILYSNTASMPIGETALHIDLAARVKGSLVRNGRRMVLVNLEGDINTNMNSLDMSYSGYQIIDIETGVSVFYKVRMNIELDEGSIEVTEETVANVVFPSADMSVPNAPTQTIEDKLLIIKRLLDTGLITEEEASEKRRDLLDKM